MQTCIEFVIVNQTNEEYDRLKTMIVFIFNREHKELQIDDDEEEI